MKTKPIQSQDFYERLSKPNNPPPTSVSDADFVREFDDVFEKLSNILSGYGENDPFGEADYYLEHNWTRSRAIGFQVIRPEFLSDKLLTQLSEYLVLCRPDWEFYLDCPSGGLFVSPDGVHYWFPSSEETPEIFRSQI